MTSSVPAPHATAAEPAFLAAPPARNILYGVWLIPAVLGALIIRKPGAAFFTELVAATVSAIIGSQWGLDTLLSGFMQGAAAELVFALTGYRVWTLPIAMIAGAAAAAGAWLHDMPIYYAALPLEAMLIIGAFMVVSAVVFAGVGSWLLMRSLAETGVLSGFPSGRDATRV